MGQIDNFIAAKVDMIILNAADSKGIAPAVKRARDAGIVVVAVDVAADGANATITSDNTEAGAMACKYIADRLKNKGNVVIINGPPVSAVQNRVEGCMTELKTHPDIKLLSYNQNAKGSREGGLEDQRHIHLIARQLTRLHLCAFGNLHEEGICQIADRYADRFEFFCLSQAGTERSVPAWLRQKNSNLSA